MPNKACKGCSQDWPYCFCPSEAKEYYAATPVDALLAALEQGNCVPELIEAVKKSKKRVKEVV